MKDLKIVLFEETLNALKQWMESKKCFGEFDRIVAVDHGRFCSLYTVIEESGLEEEYQKWKVGQVNEKR